MNNFPLVVPSFMITSTDEARMMHGFLVGNPLRWSSGDTKNGIASPAEFSRILERERERSDRSGQGFSLVVFDDGTQDSYTDMNRILIDRILSRKVRAIDEVGWFQEGSIATLLALTSADGAWKFAEDVVNGIPEGMGAPNCRVFTYPSSWISDENGGKEEVNYVREETLLSNDARYSIQAASTQRHVECEGIEKIMCRPIPLWKRFLDILGALAGIFLLSPLFLLIAIFIKIVSPGPIFFRQERIGYLGKPFTLWKFRSMHIKNNSEVHLQHIRNAIASDTPVTKLDDMNDNRIIPGGKFLRRSCIDELPQLFNVLKGDMSLIGPRPCMEYEAETLLPWQKRRFETLPGMSGLWQVSGKNRTTFKEMIRFDIRYSKMLSPLLDTKILICTVPSILGMVFHLHSNKEMLKKIVKQETVQIKQLHTDIPFRGLISD